MYIKNGVNEMEDYLNILIDMIKTEQNQSINPTEINFIAFMNRIVENTKTLVVGKSITIDYNIETINLPQYCNGEEEVLFRGIMNVISNAIQFVSEEGKIQIHAYLVNRNIVVSVSDNGRGFSKEELDLATQQFYRGDKSRHSKHNYGLGLYITKTCMEMHNGSVQLLNSEELGGAKVSLIFPLSITKNNERC